MRTIAFLIFYVLAVNCYSQGEATFFIGKSAEKKRGTEWDWNLFPGVDTLTTNGTFNFNLSPVAGLYDSISAENVEMVRKGNYLQLITPKRYCIAYLNFYRKIKPGNYAVIYKRKFVITVDQSRFPQLGMIWQRWQFVDSILRLSILPGQDTLNSNLAYSFTITRKMKLLFDKVIGRNCNLRTVKDTVSFTGHPDIKEVEPIVIQFYKNNGKDSTVVATRLFYMSPFIDSGK